MANVPIYVGIALYDGEENGVHFYHWALVTHSSAWTTQQTMIYELVVDEANSRPGARRWRLRSFAAALYRSNKLIGVVNVGLITQARPDHLHEFLISQPPTANGYYSQNGWTCATWVLRALEDLHNAELITLGYTTPDEMYLRVLDRGARLQTIPAPPFGSNQVRTINL